LNYRLTICLGGVLPTVISKEVRYREGEALSEKNV